MKRITLGVAFLLAAAGLFAQEAVIREVYGTVELRKNGVWIPARQGQKLGLQVLISTGLRSGALVAIGESTLSVRSLTRLSLEELVRTEGKETVNINLRTGRVRAEVNPPAGMATDFTVRSPMATASVRGTSFDFDGIEVRVDEGKVRLAGSDGAGTRVSAGHRAKMDSTTGRIAGAAETARLDMSPPAPAGAAASAGVSGAVLTTDMTIGFRWR
jgi:hypothetical protein